MTMAEYIDRAEYCEKYCRCSNEYCDRQSCPIWKAPAADVAPVVHGRFEDSIDEWFGTDVYTCSKCRESYVLVEGTPKENLWHHCPNCGAKMDGGNS